MGQILLGLFAAYLLYNFIFRFLIPLIRVTRQVRRQVKDFQQHVNTQGGYQAGAAGQGGFQQGRTASGHFQSGGFRVEDPGFNSSASSQQNRSSASAKQEAKPKSDDYIDFEEVK